MVESDVADTEIRTAKLSPEREGGGDTGGGGQEDDAGRLTFASLFSGIGGPDIAAERLGMRVLWHCEREPYPRSVLAARWPGVPCYPDVRELCQGGGRSMADAERDGRGTSSENPGGMADPAGTEKGRESELRGLATLPRNGSVGTDDPAPVDILWASPPCQDLSVAGKRAGLSGARSGLFFDFVRVVQTLRPRYLCMENVPGLLTSNDGRDFGTVVAELEGCGYRLEWSVLGAWEVGATHKRDRLWIIGVRDDLAACRHERQHEWDPAVESRDWQDDRIPLSDSDRLEDPANDHGRRGVCGTQEGTRQDVRGRRGLPKRGGWWNDQASTRSERAGVPPWPPGPADKMTWARVLEVRPDLAPAVAGPDGKRRLGVGFVSWLMGFPEGWCEVAGMTRAKALKALGNAVVPACAEVVLSRVLELDAMTRGAV